MSRIEKLIKRFETIPKDFTYQELRTLLNYLGYTEFHKGKTSGSRVCFYNQEKDHFIQLHKPHPGNIVSVAAARSILDLLKRKGEM